jgi:hypothetical protein
MVLTVSFVISSVIGLLSPSLANSRFCQPGWTSKNLRQLDASAGASGPHDFAVRNMHLSSSRAVRSLTGFIPPCIDLRAQRCCVHRIPPRVRDDREPPLCGTRRDEL